MESRPFGKLVPDQFLIMENTGSDIHHIIAAVSEDKSFAFVYLPTGSKVNIKMSKIGKSKVKAWWFDPRTGNASFIGEYVNMGIREFVGPGEIGRGNDWILVLDDASKNFTPPGHKQPEN
ncbi:MAG: hypothetical protein M3421_08335 [Bacteroidota bacterium]|jgi:hypothetical protein|nr:hypothetical protein [Bacteroidota bacterium]